MDAATGSLSYATVECALTYRTPGLMVVARSIARGSAPKDAVKAPAASSLLLFIPSRKDDHASERFFVGLGFAVSWENET